MRAAQRGGQTTGNQAIDDLHPLDMARRRHDLEKRGVERQRSLVFCEIGRARLAQQLRLLPIDALGVGIIHSVDIFDDRKARGAERVSEQKRAGVSAVNRDTRAWELMVVIGRKGAAYDRAGGGEMDRKLVRDRAVLDIGDAFGRKQRCEDVAILASLARSQRREGADRKSQVEGDAVKVTRANTGARQNEQTMLLHHLAQLFYDRKDRVRAAIHDRATAYLHDLHPGEE